MADGASASTTNGSVGSTCRRPNHGRRPLWTAVLGLLLGAAALWGSSRLPWLTAGGPGSDVTGAEVADWLVPFALVAVAAVAAVLALGGIARRLLGGVLVVLGGVAVYLAFRGPQAWVSYSPGPPERALLGPAVAVVGAGLLVAVGVLLAWRGHRMPRLGAKYSAPAAKRVEPDSDERLWKALSEGDDPTVGG